MSLRSILQGAVRVSGFLPLARHLDSRSDALRVVVYHRIADLNSQTRGDPTLISASPEMFRIQLRYLVQHYRPVGGQQVLQAVRRETALPPRAVLVTFDDGYRDFATHAWPALKEYGVPAVMFIPTAFPEGGQAFWWDVLHDVVAVTGVRHATLPLIGPTALGTKVERQVATRRLNRRLRFMSPAQIEELLHAIIRVLETPVPAQDLLLSWDDLRSLVRDGLMVAPHTRHHPAIPFLQPGELAAEIKQAQRDLHRELGDAPPIFAYPFGMADPDATSIIENEGIEAAFTMAPGANVIGETDPLLLCRRAVNCGRSSTDFALSLISTYARLQHWHWRRTRGSREDMGETS